MTIPFIYYAQRHKFAWTFAFSQWMKIHKFFLPTTRIFELERILTSFEKVEESRRSKRKKKKKLDKVKESKKNRLDGDKSFIIWSCGVARLEKTSRQQATSPKLRAGFLVHLIFRLLSDLTGVGVLLTIFWVAPLGLTEWHISRTSHTSNLQFWYVLVPFFVFFLFFMVSFQIHFGVACIWNSRRHASDASNRNMQRNTHMGRRRVNEHRFLQK